MSASIAREETTGQRGTTGQKRERGLCSVPPLNARRPAVRVSVVTSDPMVRVGVLSELRDKPGVQLLDGQPSVHTEVIVAVAEAENLPEVLSGVRVHECVRLVLVADQPRPAELLTAIECGLVILVPRHEATPARLVRAIADAHQGRGELPADQLGHLLRRLTSLHHEVLAPRGLTLSGLSPRETDVLRLLAEGMDTAEIATEMTYSERTVKNILHSLLARLGLRNRTHAVAHALRYGLI